MANKDLKLKPTDLDDGSIWYYETAAGIELWNARRLLGTITWRKMRAMLKRKDEQPTPPAEKGDE
ncbi:MAG: hypothetical protein ACYSUP_16840 [Planctomycetota bacterium]|jgi:hypothetical protein